MKQSRIDIKARSQRRIGEIGMMYIDIKVVMLYMINSFSVDNYKLWEIRFVDH